MDDQWSPEVNYVKLESLVATTMTFLAYFLGELLAF